MVAIAGRGFAFPAATHAAIGKTGSRRNLMPYVTVGEALRDLPAPAIKKNRSDSPPADSHFDVTPPRDRERIHGVPEGGCLASQVGLLPPSQICGLTKKDTTKFRRTSRRLPSNTLGGGEIFYHPVADRYPTPRE